MKTAIHCRDCGAAVNVKFYGDASLPEGGEDGQRETAYMRTVEAWWRDAKEAARTCGYSGVSACGRSGGWCAPYDGGDDTRATFETDENAPRFVAFVGKIEALMKGAPDRFAEELRDAIREDEASERERAANAKRRELEARFCAGFRDEDLENAFNAATDIGAAYNALRAARPVSLLSIDAWREAEGGWTWNAWHKLESVPVGLADMKPRELLRALRVRGWNIEPGRVAVEDDGFNIVVKNKGDGMPRCAIAYGEARE